MNYEIKVKLGAWLADKPCRSWEICQRDGRFIVSLDQNYGLGFGSDDDEMRGDWIGAGETDVEAAHAALADYARKQDRVRTVSARPSSNPTTTLEELHAARGRIAELEARCIDLQLEPASLAAANIRLQERIDLLRAQLAEVSP